MEVEAPAPSDKVAPVLTEDKAKYFRDTLIQTLLGVSWQHQTVAGTIIAYVLPPLVLLIVAALVSDSTLCFVLGSVLPPAAALAVKLCQALAQRCIRKQDDQPTSQCRWQQVAKVSCLTLFNGGYCFLATVHFRFLFSQADAIYIGLSATTLVTSMATLHWSSVKEFGMQNHVHNELSWHSCSLVRPILSVLVLIPEAVLYWQQPNGTPFRALQIVYGWLWLAWTLGIVSQLKTTCLFLMEAINTVVLGEQKKHTFARTAASLFLNVVVIFAIHTDPLDDMYLDFNITNSVIVLCSFITSLGLFNWILDEPEEVGIHPKTSWLEICLELLLVGVKVGITLALGFLRPDTQAVVIVMAIDIAVFAIMILIRELNRSRMRLCTLGVECMSGQAWLTATRWVLRLSLDFAVTFLSYNAYTSGVFQNNYVSHLALNIITYRSYKRALLNPAELSPRLGILLGLICMSQLPLFVIPLLMITLPDGPGLLFASSCVIPKKNEHRLEWLYKAFYAVATFIGFIVCLCSAGMLQPLMLFGLPVFLWSLPNYAESSYAARGKERSIYQNLVRTLPPVVKSLERGTYLIRISKYLTLCRVLERGIGYRVAEFRGLESQDVTSCHNIESQTVDNTVEQTWGDNKVPCASNFLMTTLRPLRSTKHMLFEENEIKLTGIIESEEFVQLFKNHFLRTILMYFRAQGVSKTQMSQLRKIKNNFGFIIPEREAFDMYPHKFAEKLGPDFEFHQTLQKQTTVEPIIVAPPKPVQKLPPVKQPIKQPKQQSRQLFQDLQFMVDDTVPVPTVQASESKPQLSAVEQSTAAALVDHPKQLKHEEKTLHKLLDSDHEPSLQGSELTHPCYAELALSFVVYCIGRNKFIDQKKLFSLMKSKDSAEKTLKNIEFDHKGEIAMLALRSSLKLSIDAFVGGDLEPMDIEQIAEEMSKSYVGVMEEKEFEEAIMEKKEHIWVLNFKEQLHISRYTDHEVDLHLFELEESVVKGIWNNMRFQLYYVTNDDDERYSIQTHPHFLRNVLVEASLEPLGYAPYYSGALAI